MKPRAIVTDIEGTTTSIAFVHEVLFPYARARLADYVRTHPQETAPLFNQVRAEAQRPAMSVDDCIGLLLEWHDADRKTGALKTLQGMIWADGYAGGALVGHVYPDAVRGLRRWRARGVALYVYSSGSVAAQRLLFGHTYGDLTPLFSGYFDTAVGAKAQAASYREIAARAGLAAEAILFLSDAEAELAAARATGFEVTLLARGSCAIESAFPVVESFDDILPDTPA